MDNVLKRMIAAHAGGPSVEDASDAGLAHVFGRALRHGAAGLPAFHVEVQTSDASLQLDLASAIALLPKTGMVLVLEDPSGQRGLLALSHVLADALIEVQTTGRVEAVEHPPRSVTEIDLALSRDFVDLTLAAFAHENAGLASFAWPDTPRFGSRVRDLSQIALLLPDTPYWAATVALGFRGAEKTGQAVLILPEDRKKAARPTDGQSAPQEDWGRQMKRVVDGAPTELEAVLLRRSMSFAEVASLQVGDELPFAAMDVQTVSLEIAGMPVFSGRLGQIGGKRAVRLSGGEAEANTSTVSEAPPVPPSPTAPEPDPADPAALVEAAAQVALPD